MIYSCYPSVVQVAEIILVLECFLPPGELQVHEGIQALEQRLNESQLSAAFDWIPSARIPSAEVIGTLAKVLQRRLHARPLGSHPRP